MTTGHVAGTDNIRKTDDINNINTTDKTDEITNKPGDKVKYRYFVIAFFLPVIIMTAAFALYGIYPFGKLQLLIADLYHQYYPFYSDLWFKLREGSSLLWSWTSGGGINYLAQLAGYASPLTPLIALFPHEWLREVLNVMLLIKLGMCGLFFAVFLYYSFKRCDITLAIFGLFYALCAFTLGYYYNIMWFDTIALFPLVMMGCHALVRDGKWRLYTVSLALSVLCCYHIAMFTCIFTLIIFFVFCIIEKINLRLLLRRFLLIAVCTIIALGMTAFLMLPLFFALQDSAAVGDVFPRTLKNYESYIDILGNFIAFTPPTILRGLPNVYSGLLSILLLGPFIISKKIPLRLKIIYLGLFAFLIISSNMIALNFIWHGFHYPASLPYRFSYIISFALIFIAFKSLANIEDMGWKELLAMTISGAFFHICAIFGNHNALFMETESIGSIETGDVLASAGLAAGYIILFAMRFLKIRKITILVNDIDVNRIIAIENEIPNDINKTISIQDEFKTESFECSEGIIKRITKRSVLTQKSFIILLLIIVILEFTISAHLGIATIGITASFRDIYPDYYNDIQTLLDTRDYDEIFYRTELAEFFVMNNPALYNYDGISLFSSSSNRVVTQFMRNLGLMSKYNNYVYSYGTPLTDALLNIKYQINYKRKEIDADIYWNSFKGGNILEIYENNFYLPLGFIAESDLINYWGEDLNPFYNQNEFFCRAIGIYEDLFIRIESLSVNNNIEIDDYIENNNNTFENNDVVSISYKTTCDGPVYAYIEPSDRCFIIIKSNDEVLRWINIRFPLILYVGEFKEDDVVTFDINLIDSIHTSNADIAEDNDVNLYIYIDAVHMNHEFFKTGYDILSAETMELVEFTDTYVKGNMNTSKGGLLYTSIPYEKGWKAFVNGVETEITPVGNAMTALQLSPGQYDIEFKYTPYGFIPGMIISIISVIIFCGAVIFKYRKNRI